MAASNELMNKLLAKGVSPHPALAGGHEPPQDNDMIERVAKLEARLDAVLPTLSTKADMEGLRSDLKQVGGDLRGDLHKNHSDIQRWMIGTIIALFLGMVGWGTFLSNGLKGMMNSGPASAAAATLPPQPQPIIIQLPNQPQPPAQMQPPKQSGSKKQP